MSLAPDTAAQIQSIDQHVEGLRNALNRARMLRVLILLVLITVVVAIVYSFMNLANRVSSESFVNEVTTLAQKHVTDHQDVYQKEMQQLVDKSFPVVRSAFNAQAQKDLPKFTEAVNKERDVFITNLRERMDEKLAVRYKDLLKQHEQMIVTEFPELKDEATRERVLANFQLVIEKLVKRNYGDQFDEESKKLVQIWESFPAAEEPGPSDPKLEEKLLEHALQVAAGVMSTVQQANTETAPATTPVATPTVSKSTPAASTAAEPVKVTASTTGEGRKLPPVIDEAADAKGESKSAEETPKAETAKTDAPPPEAKEAPKKEPAEAEAPKSEPEKPKEEPAQSPPAPNEPPKK